MKNRGKEVGGGREMEYIMYMTISFIGLTLLFFLLPIRWSALGKAILSFFSSLIGILFIFLWGILPTIQTILLYFLFTITISYLLIKKGASLFTHKKEQIKRNNHISIQPLFNYQEQLRRAKLSQPAESVSIYSRSVTSRAEAAATYMYESEETSNSSLIDTQLKPLSQEEVSFILEESQQESIQINEGIDSLVEDEPGYLLEDWIEPNSSDSIETNETIEVNSVTTLSMNIISIEEKRKEKSDQHQPEVLDWLLSDPEALSHTQEQVPTVHDLENLAGIESKVNDSNLGVIVEGKTKDRIRKPDSSLQSQIDLEIEDEDDSTTLVGRAFLLNDGIANLYKERADAAKKVKLKDEDADLTLMDQKQFLKALSSRFSASNE